jgi:hypothetical protein
MTRMEQMIWAANFAVVFHYENSIHEGPRALATAISEADEIVLRLRGHIAKDGRLHQDDDLEDERIKETA